MEYYKNLAESLTKEPPTPIPAENVTKVTPAPADNLTVSVVESKEDNSIPDTRQLVSYTASHSSQTSNGAGSNYHSTNSHWQSVDGEVVESSYVSELNNVANANYNNKKTSKAKMLVIHKRETIKTK